MSLKQSFVIIGSLLIAFSASSASIARADWLIDRSGTLVQVEGYVLGDDDSSDDQDEVDDDSDDDGDLWDEDEELFTEDDDDKEDRWQG